jgi:cystathionine beta-lyase/cystathionine gamma-synthase
VEQATLAAAAHAPVDAALVAESARDLRDDFDELLFLARSALARLDALEAEVGSGRAGLHAGTASLLRSQVSLVRSRCAEAGRRLVGLKQDAERATGADELATLDAARAQCAELLRTQQVVAAGLATAADWQSPPFLASTTAAVGAEFGRIEPHRNDYKRDRHLDAEAYEDAYVEELVGAPGEWRALLTTCGMAAFTTILAYLALERKLERPVVAGRALYHETKLLLEGAAPATVFVDEEDTDSLLRALREHRPGAVFLDSLCNTRRCPLPDLAAVAEELDRLGSDVYLVVDNTGLGPAFRATELAAGRPRLGLVVFESLLKYHQLGLDRANAGVLVARPDDAELLSRYREHLGTNIGDVAALALPPPRRYVLERRLARIGRNAMLIAERLEEARRRAPALVEAVAHPGLASHPSTATARRLPFRGGCVSIALRRRSLERRLVREAVAEARRRGVALVGGSSFGFDTTRVYLTAARAEHGEDFVRVAAGSEHRLAAERVADALAAALRRLVRT